MKQPSPFDVLQTPLVPGVTLLEASAGTGKTYTLVGILLRLLLEGDGLPLERALVVTFTVAATEELKQRLRAGLVQVLATPPDAASPDLFAYLAAQPGAAARCRIALDDFDRAAIATIHGFCKRVLDEAAFASGEPFALDFQTEPRPRQERAAADVLRMRYEARPGPTSATLQFGELTPGRLVDLYTTWQRHAGVRLEPHEPDLPATQQALVAALEQVRAAFAADRDVLTTVRWKAGEAPWIGPGEPVLDTLAQRLADDPWLAAVTFAGFGKAALADKVYKTSAALLDRPLFDACDTLHGAFTTHLEHLRSTLLHELHERCQQAARSEQTLSFDDLLRRTAHALRDARRGDALREQLRSRYQVALIDEFQDTDALQYEVFHGLFADRQLYLIGDPKQSIYGFRGADLSAYLDAAAAADRDYTLAVNFRSSPDLVEAVNHLFGGVGAFVEPRIAMHRIRAHATAGQLQIDGDLGHALQWRTCAAETSVERARRTIAADVAAEIARLLQSPATLDGRRLGHADFAVLVRSHPEADAVRAALRQVGIPAAIGKSGDVLDTDEADELERALHAVLHPRDLAAVRAGLATRLWGKDARWLQQTVADESTLEPHLEHLDLLRRRWHKQDVMAMTTLLFEFGGTVSRLRSAPDGERALTNHRHLLELLHEAAHAQRLPPDRLLEWLRHARQDRHLVAGERRTLRLESDADAVKILTVHGSKGLQYEIVFCPFLHGRMRADAPRVVGTGRQRTLRMTLTDAEAHQATLDGLAEELRLAYVALTRARRRCYVHLGATGAKDKQNDANALSWLLWRPALDVRDDRDAFAAWERHSRAMLHELAEQLPQAATFSAATMAMATVQPTVVVPLPPAAVDPRHQPRRAERQPVPRRITSFSGLVAGSTGNAGQLGEFDPRDHDERSPRRTSGDAASPAEGIFAFARGAAAGTCLHQILELVDLQQLAAPATATTVRDVLQRHRLADPGDHLAAIDPVATVLANLRDLAAARVDAPTGTPGPTVADLCGPTRAAEWRFLLPSPGGNLGQLANLLQRHGSPLARRFATTLRQGDSRLLRETLHGFLTGSVDLVTEHAGRFWIVDWKSNHLGNQLADYRSEALADAMLEAAYVLQYHLYAIAVHRQLRERVPACLTQAQPLSVLYAFVRGAAAGTDSGMFVDTVSAELLVRLDEWLGGPGHQATIPTFLTSNQQMPPGEPR